MKNIFFGIVLIITFNNAYADTQHQPKGFILSGEGSKCWFIQNDEKNSFYFSKNKTNYNLSVSTITFDNPNCMAKDSMGMGQDPNKMMINGKITGWYSHSDANFGTKVSELYDTSWDQSKGSCIQSKKYRYVSIAVDYVLNDKGSIASVKHTTAVAPCFDNIVDIVVTLDKSEENNLKKFTKYAIKKKLVKKKLDAINIDMNKLRLLNSSRIGRLIKSLKNSNVELLKAAASAQDKRSMWNGAKENVDIYSQYLGSNQIAKNALLFYNKMYILNKKLKSYGNTLNLKDAETMLIRSAIGKTANDGDFAKAILMYSLDRESLIIVAKGYLESIYKE